MAAGSTSVNILRVFLVVLAIIVLLVGTLSSIDSNSVHFAILPCVYLIFGTSLSARFKSQNDHPFESAGSPQLLSARAPPVF